MKKEYTPCPRCGQDPRLTDKCLNCGLLLGRRFIVGGYTKEPKYVRDVTAQSTHRPNGVAIPQMLVD